MFNLSSHIITRCRKIVAVTLHDFERSRVEGGMSDMDFDIVVSVVNVMPLAISIT